jgi:hypothetical protein
MSVCKYCGRTLSLTDDNNIDSVCYACAGKPQNRYQELPVKPDRIPKFLTELYRASPGRCLCNYLVKQTWKFCPNCGRQLDWSDDE